MLSVNDLQVYYGSIHAIKGISFDVNEGEIVTLIGANGAGKSTTLNTIGGLLKPQLRQHRIRGCHHLLGTAPHKIVSKGMALMSRRDAGSSSSCPCRRIWRWAPIPAPRARSLRLHRSGL